jgi:hypothetical protein
VLSVVSRARTAGSDGFHGTVVVTSVVEGGGAVVTSVVVDGPGDVVVGAVRPVVGRAVEVC